MIRGAFIGTGGISGVHLEVLKEHDDLEIVALCDNVKENAEKKQQDVGGAVYTDFQKMLDSESPDAVWICTPSEVREEPLLACAEKGISIFCEKPVERSAEKAGAIADRLDELNARVQVGYVFRSNPVNLELKRRIRNDRIHLVQSFYACGVSLKMDLPPWFYDKEKSGGALIDQATHNFDLLRFFLGEVKEIKGLAGNPVNPKGKGYTIDEVMALSFLFEDGTAGSHTHTWVGDGWRNEIVLSGEKAVYRLDPGKQFVVDAGTGQDPLDSGNGNEGERDTFGPGEKPLFAYENDTFLDMVRTGDWSGNPSEYRDALKTLQLTLACDRALTQEEVVRV